jgi:hypothetical protein
MPSPAEVAYRASVRALDGQGRDLTTIRSHVSLTLSTGGLAAVFLGSLAHGQGPAFWVGLAMFVVLALLTIRVHWPADFVGDFDGSQLVTDYVDQEPLLDDDLVMRDLAVHASADYEDNRRTLERLWTLQSIALLAFGVEILALLVNAALES